MLPALTIPQDTGLPQLAAILDDARMGAAFEAMLRDNDPSANLTVTDCRTQWIKYKPGNNCTVCYRLTVEESRSRHQGEQIVYGRIYADGGGRGRFVKVQPAHLTRPTYGRPMMYLAQLDMLVWFFPNDRKLAGLPFLVDKAQLRKGSLGDAVRTLCGSDWYVDEINFRLVHYVPEHGCTARVEVVAKRAGSGAARELTLFGKCYSGDGGAETYRLMNQLWHHAANDPTALRVARPCSYHPEHKILWQSQVTGTTLLQQEMGSQGFCDSLPAAAAAVAALHNAALQCSNKMALNDWLQKLRELRGFLPRVVPSCEIHLVALTDHLCREAARLPDVPDATLHGDLHLGNILTENGKAALIDLDGLANGPALMDIGSFIAAMIFHGMIQRSEPSSLNEMVEVFLREYRRAARGPVAEFALRWHVAAALVVERAYRCVSRLKAGRVELVDDVIEAAHRIGLTATGWGRS